MAEITIDTERLRYVIFEKMKDPLSRELFLDQIFALVDAVVSDLAPPRPVEPPSVVTASGWTVTWDALQFKAGRKDMLLYRREWSHQIAHLIDATEAEHDAIRALRDGPTARYEVCGWRVIDKNGEPVLTAWNERNGNSAERCEQIAKASNELTRGGTAHAIYKRVGGA